MAHLPHPAGIARLRAARPVLAWMLLALLAACARDGDRLPPGYELPYGPAPFLPAESSVSGAKLLPRDALAGSAACGRCHVEIARQWQSSLHRGAGTDVFSQFAIGRMAEDYGVAATRICTGCHVPGQLLAGGIDRGAAPDPTAQREGVSCLSCHLVTSVHASKQNGAVANAAYEITPVDNALLFPDPTQGASATRRHAQALHRPFLSLNHFCDACHRFFVPVQLGGSPPGRLRLQSAEAQGSRYGDPAAPGYKSCVDCHMPLVKGSDPAAKKGMVHDHRALGANVLIPTLAGDTPHAQATEAFRRAGAVTLTIGDFVRNPAGALSIPVTLRNEHNGHDFPTGATDVSESWIELQLSDAGGKVVFRSPGLDKDHFLWPDAPSLNSLVALASGDIDFLHDLFAQVELRRHPRIKPQTSRQLDVAVDLPRDATPPFSAQVVLRARHGNERWNRWAFNWDPVVVPVTDLAQAQRSLPSVPPQVALPPPPPQPALPPPPGMVLVPAGAYPIGANMAEDPDAEQEESPRHLVDLRAFFLDRLPVTNATYAVQVRAGKVRAPVPVADQPMAAHGWRGGKPPVGLDDHPIAAVTAGEADAYCRAVGKRLPTESEWEAAARGPTGQRFAWGDTFDAARCNTVESGVRHSLPAGSAPSNASWVGALDLGCNVSEWVASAYFAYPRTRLLDNRADWVDHFADFFRVVRGGNYETSWRHARGSARGFDAESVRKLIGFRCAQDAGPKAPQGGKP